MSDSGSGFDWLSILAIIVAGGIGLFKSLVNKSKQQSGSLSGKPQHEYQTEEEDDVIERYTDLTTEEESQQSVPDFESASAGDYYNEKLREGIPAVQFDEDTETLDEKVYDFDIRQAIIGSEILRRPQY